MKLRKAPLLTGLLTATTLLAACDGSEHGPSEHSSLRAVRAESRVAQGHEIPSRIEVRGVVEAEKSAAISSRVAAMVTRVRANAGDQVARGQVLIEIDPATARGQVSQATGALAQARAALTLAEKNYGRFRLLAEKEAASALELDMALMQFEQAKGAVEQAEGAVGAAQSVASESTVRAPFDGFVVRRMVDVGDLAAPGRPLMMIESVNGRRLALAVPASLLARSALTVGETVDVRLDGREDLGTIVATIVERSPAADPMSHSFEVKVELPAPQPPAQEISSGTTGRAWIGADGRHAVTVPKEALLRQGGLSFVVTVDDHQRTESRIVTVGDPVGDSDIEILSGLSGGERILVGLQSLPPTGSPFEAAS